MRISDWSSDVCSSDRSEERTPTCGKSRLRERAKDDVAERREAVQDERERTDVEDLADQSAEHIILAAQSPEQPGQRDVERDQGAAEEADVGPQQPEPAVDVAEKRSEERRVGKACVSPVRSRWSTCN